jgi:hypothetical protein
MNDVFEVAAGSLCGREHERTGKNSQDALRILSGDGWLVCIVADGCGSGAHSEVGAKLGSELVANLIAGELRINPENRLCRLLERVRKRALGELSALSSLIPGTIEERVTDFFLFTLVGCVVTELRTAVFSLGDGVVGINSAITVLDHANTPPYLGYGLLARPDEDAAAAAPRFEIHADLSTKEVDSLLLATDGFAKVYSLDKDDPRHTAAEQLGHLWEHDRFFSNPARVTRELTLLGRPKQTIDWERRRMSRPAGVFDDDSTVIAIRRRRAPLYLN